MVSKEDPAEQRVKRRRQEENHFLTLDYYCRIGESRLVHLMLGIRADPYYFMAIGSFMYRLMMTNCNTDYEKREGIILTVGRDYVTLAKLNEHIPPLSFTLPNPRQIFEFADKMEKPEDVVGELEVLASMEHPFVALDNAGGILGIYTRGAKFRPRSEKIREVSMLGDLAQRLAHNSTHPVGTFIPRE